VRLFPAFAALTLWSIFPAAAETPLPRPRPPLEAPAAPAPPAEAGPSACQVALAGIAVFQGLPNLSGAGGCGAEDAVSLEAILLPDKTSVAVTPPATLRCGMAESIARWVREDVAPATRALGAALRGIDNFASFECRGRNRIAFARLSEHGRANALDVRGFALAGRPMAALTDPALSRAFREAIRRSVCARFMTVLGPGSDGYHESHIHLDLAERRGNYRTCQWDVRDPAPIVPLPRPRPAEAPQ
jgi:hypothetical protein